MRQTFFIVNMLLIGIMAATGCSQPEIKEYSGPPVPREKNVRLYVPEQLYIVSLDGKQVQRPSEPINGSSYIDIFPGRHSITVAAAEDSKTKTLSFKARPGSRYRLSYSEYDKRISGSGHTYHIAFKWKVQVKEILSSHVTSGLTYHRKGEYDRAIYEFGKAIKLNSNDIHAYHYRGIAYFKKGDYELAISDFTKGMEIDPDYSWFYVKRADVYFQLNDNEKACVDLRRACALGTCETYNLKKKEKVCQ